MEASGPARAMSALAKRPFTAQLNNASSSQQQIRHLKRIHVAAEILKAAKICAGDALVLTRMLDMDQMSLSDVPKPQKMAVGIAWPSFSLGGNALTTSPVMLANAGLEPGDTASIYALDSSSVHVAEAAKVHIVHDAKTKVGSDSFFQAYIKEALAETRYVTSRQFLEINFNGQIRRLAIASVEASPAQHSNTNGTTVYLVTRETNVSLSAPKASSSIASNGQSTKMPIYNMPGYEAIGGMDAQIEQIRELVEWPLTRPDLYRHFGLRAPKGILLYGPPGSGKTLLALSIARSTKSSLITINGPSLSSAYHGETEAKLRDIFEQAKASSPSIIVMDEVDALVPNREDSGEVERRVVATLLMLMDGLDSKEDVETNEDADPPRVIVIACTNRPNAIDPALRRPGRFDKELEIGVPDVEARQSILQVLLKRTPHSLADDDFTSLASRTHGFVGADLSALVNSAGLLALKRALHSMETSQSDSTTETVTMTDFEAALLGIRPSAMREVFLETPKVHWRDIGGQHEVKARLRESVEWPLRHPQTFKRLGVAAPRGILLYGPPGCSKTLIAKALATEGGLNFIAVKGPEVFNKYVGESEKAVRELFRKARAAAPSIVFLDEVDALAPARGSDESSGPSGDRVLLSLLTEMDGIEELNGVIVLAATNRPDVIDPALMRPGRLDRILYVGPPDLESRKEIFRVRFETMAVAPDIDIDELAQTTEGCSGAEIALVCQDAALLAMHEDLDALHVTQAHLMKAARSIRRRITQESLREYEAWRDQSGLRNA